MDSGCGDAISDFNHASHDFSSAFGNYIDNSPDVNSLGFVAETGVNAGSSWLAMDAACHASGTHDATTHDLGHHDSGHYGDSGY